jgi:hypothetical protein
MLLARVLPLLLIGLVAGTMPSNRNAHLKNPPDYNMVPADQVVAMSATTKIGAVTNFSQTDNHTFSITAGADQVRVIWYDENTVRVWLGVKGNFSDPASAEIVVVGLDDIRCIAKFTETADAYSMSAGDGVTLVATKNPLAFKMTRGPTVLWEETAGLSWNGTATFQTLATSADEYYFGAGMQNGRFSHKGHRVRISKDFNWADGGNPNSAPFYVSSAGYGVRNNTITKHTNTH